MLKVKFYKPGARSGTLILAHIVQGTNFNILFDLVSTSLRVLLAFRFNAYLNNAAPSLINIRSKQLEFIGCRCRQCCPTMSDMRHSIRRNCAHARSVLHKCPLFRW